MGQQTAMLRPNFVWPVRVQVLTLTALELRYSSTQRTRAFHLLKGHTVLLYTAQPADAGMLGRRRTLALQGCSFAQVDCSVYTVQYGAAPRLPEAEALFGHIMTYGPVQCIQYSTLL